MRWVLSPLLCWLVTLEAFSCVNTFGTGTRHDGSIAWNDNSPIRLLRLHNSLKHWGYRASERLSWGMGLVAVLLGVMPCPGGIFVVMVFNTYKNKGYERKAKSFAIGAIAGFILFCIGWSLLAPRAR